MKAFFHTVLYQPLYNLLILLAWLVPGHSIAIAIIILTIIIRIILLPSSLKAAHFQVKSLSIQPKVNKIRAEIKDPHEQQKALAALYKEEEFSPFGSCLPILIQIPIIWVLFAVFKNGLNVGGYSDLYSFIPRPDTVNVMFLGFDVTKTDAWILPIIAGVLQFVLSWLTMPPKKKQAGEENDPMAMMSKQMLFVGPLITVFFGRQMPVALVIYWITTTIFGIVQQYYVNKTIKNKAPQATIDQTEKIIPEKKKADKRDMMQNIINKRLDRAEKKSGVNVTVRTKKK